MGSAQSTRPVRSHSQYYNKLFDNEVETAMSHAQQVLIKEYVEDDETVRSLFSCHNDKCSVFILKGDSLMKRPLSATEVNTILGHEAKS